VIKKPSPIKERKRKGETKGFFTPSNDADADPDPEPRVSLTLFSFFLSIPISRRSLYAATMNGPGLFSDIGKKAKGRMKILFKSEIFVSV
jgi:hypothetical protein